MRARGRRRGRAAAGWAGASAGAGLAQEVCHGGDGARLGGVVEGGPEAECAVLGIDRGGAALERAAEPGDVVVAGGLEELRLGGALPLAFAGEELEVPRGADCGGVVIAAVRRRPLLGADLLQLCPGVSGLHVAAHRGVPAATC